ncbi:MAG: hypothetical protein IAE91_01395 [Ignavibacteriaceae bacterium]|nr:hypothetical protein [Ignavibacteriaceae bacterium]
MAQHREQKQFIDELKRFEYKMIPKDRDSFKMLLKRHIDEEEFDTISMKILRELHEKYCSKKPDRSKLENLFKKQGE